MIRQMLIRTIVPIIILSVFVLSVFVLFGCSKNTEEVSTPSTGAIFGTSEKPSEEETKPVTEVTTESETTTEAPTNPETTTEVPTNPETTTEPPTNPETTTEPPTNPETNHETTTEALLTIDDIAFIGDSRTLTMATGGRYEFGLIPSSSVFATWGGELTQDSARQNAQAAASANRKLAIFWYGINDVQSDPEQKLAPQFVANYEAIIELYRNINPDSKIVILSILSTSVHEKDYYDGQEENIHRYNVELAALCAENNYTYLDITELFTGDECLAPDDYIHFSRDWYAHFFLPEVFSALGIDS